MRLGGEAHNLKIGAGSRYVAFTDSKGFRLSVLDVQNRKIYKITDHFTGGSFFTSPDGHRIFYRELIKSQNGSIHSLIKVYDIQSRRRVDIGRVESGSGFLTFDPRDLRFQLMHDQGILSKMIVFPDERLAKWQLAQRTDQGKFLGTPKGLIWLTHSGFTMRKLPDDDSGIQSFDISPDGSTIVWATKKANIYFSELGQKPVKIGEGFDPSWHPVKPLVVYAGARRIGKKIISTDIRLIDLEGKGRWVTHSQSAAERWPRWFNGGRSIICSLEKTTDLFKIDIKP